MKHNKLFIALVSIVLIFSSCSKNNTPDPIVPPEVEEPDGEDKPKEGIFVLSGRSGLAGADVLYTSSTLDEGVLVTAGTGVEQSGSRAYIKVNDLFLSMKFGGGGAGGVTAYKVNSDKALEKVTDFQTETMTASGAVGDDVLMMKQAWQPAEDFTQWFRFNSKTLQIENQGELNVKELAGVDKNEKAFFTSLNKVGDKVFAPYWSIQSAQAFYSNYLDSTWIAVYDYPSMTLNKVIRDGRTGSIGAYFASGLEIDEKEDIYVFGTKLGYKSSTDNLSKTPSGIMKIAKGMTEYDKTYFFDLSKTMGEGNYLYRKMYLGKGNFLLTVGERQSYNPYGTTLTIIYKSLLRFAIVNVYDGTFKWVTGAPEPATIFHTSVDYSNNYSALDGTGYLSLTTGSFGNTQTTIYKFDASTAAARPGLNIDNGNIAITEISWVPVTE